MPREAAMVDATPIEQAALRSCLKCFGAAASTIGFDKPLGAYSEVDALSVISAIVTGYVEAMTVHHEKSKYPPVHMLGETAISDPIAASAIDAFAELEDLPWETK